MKKISRGLLMVAAICGSAGMMMPACAAEKAPEGEWLPEYRLEQIVVTATRTEKPLLEIPANAMVITGRQMREKGYTSVFEAVRDMSQANAHTYQEDGGDYGGMMSRIRLRGVDNGTLVLLNGIPVTHGNMSTVSTIPMGQIEKIEIVKGANSVLYGAQAVGGVINVITRRPGAEGGKIHGDVSGSIGSRYKDYGVNVQSDIINIGYKQSWTSDFYGATPGPKGYMPGSNLLDRQQESVYADVRLAKDLSMSYGRVYRKGIYQSDYGYGPSDDYDDYTYNNYNLLYDSKETGWHVAAGYNTRNVYAPNYKIHYTGYNANLNIQKKIDLNPDRNTLVLGADLKRDSMKSEVPVGSMYYAYLGGTEKKNGYTTYSLFQSYDHAVNEKFNLIFGLREYWINQSNYQGRDFQLLPQIQGLYKLNDVSSAYFNVGKSYVMPSPDTGFYKGKDFAVNDDLKPQSSWTYEAGYKYEKGKASIAADIFYMNVKDKFYWGRTEDNKSILLNGKKWKNTGLEVSYKQSATKNFDFSAGITMQNPRLQADNGCWGQDTAKYIINAGTNYHRGKFMADARIFSYLKREKAYYNKAGSYLTKDHNLKNYCDVALTLSYSPTDMDTFRVAGYNLLDRRDFINNYEYYTAPARYVMTYERKF